MTLLDHGKSVSVIARETGLSMQAIYRIRDYRVEAEAELAEWSL